MSAKIGSIFIGIIILFIFIARSVFALDFGQAYIRFDRMQTSSALSGLVCAKPSSAGAGNEAKVQVIFPSDFSINTSTSNWTTSTTNLPGGTTAWPSIGASASTVSGTTVTFSGGDLTNGASTYCFRFTGNSSTTASTTGNKNGYIRTLLSDDTVVNSTQFGVVLVNNDQVTVTATVPANSTDFSAVLTQLTPGTQFNQNTEIEYQLTYGSTLSTAANITVQAEWSRGTVSGDVNPSVDILDYVVGSASNGYGGAAPVIDTVNRTISWEINSFPANTTGQTVTFTLKTNSSYTGSSTVSFSVSGRVIGPGAQTADSTVTASYLYNPPPTPTPTPTSIPTPTFTLTPTPALTNTPTPGPSATPRPPTSNPTPPLTATPVPTRPFVFDSIDVDTISSDSANIRVVTSQESTLQFQYGTSAEDLSESVDVNDFYNQHIVSLLNLTPNTRYYFKITAKNRTGSTIRSDIFTFVTALAGEKPEFIGSSLIVTSQKVLMYSPALFPNIGGAPIVFSLPANTPFEVNFRFAQSDLIDQSKLLLRNKEQLRNGPVNSVDMTQLVREIFSGKLKSTIEIGTYEVIAKVHDINGNIFEQHIADLKNTQPITVREAGSAKPIEHARILLYVYNSALRSYELISNSSVPIPNPAFTNVQGEAAVVLPHGSYKLDISANGYVSKTVPFTLGSREGEDFPQVFLEKEPFNFVAKIRYFYETFIDAFASTQQFVFSISYSMRFFELVSLGVTLALSYIILLALSAKLRVPAHSVIDSMLHCVAIHPVIGNQTEDLKGIVAGEKDKTVEKADVYLLNKNHKVLSHAVSDKDGVFVFKVEKRKAESAHYHIEVIAKGFEPMIFDIQNSADPMYRLNSSVQMNSTIGELKHYVHDIAEMGFELFLILACAFEVVIGLVLGWEKVVVFVAASLIASVVWFRHMEKRM